MKKEKSRERCKDRKRAKDWKGEEQKKKRNQGTHQDREKKLKKEIHRKR